MFKSDEHVEALTRDVWNDFEGSPFIDISERDAESIARSVLDSPAMRDLLAEERAKALREAAENVRLGAPVGNETYSAQQVAQYLDMRARLTTRRETETDPTPEEQA